MRWRTYSEYLKSRYGASVFRIGVDAGFSCPNRDATRHGGCAFCDGTGSVAVYQRRSESGFTHSSAFDADVASTVISRCASIADQIAKGREFLARRYGAEMFSLYFQSFTNTYDSVENLRRIYDSALELGDFREFIVSTRPDQIDDGKAELLASYRDRGLDVWVELGLQSANDRTLERIGRGHDRKSYLDAAEIVSRHGLLLSTHVIIGLPGEGRPDYEYTAETVNEARSDAIKIHNLHIAGGTRLADEYSLGAVRVMEADEYVEELENFIRHLRPDMIIQRLVSETPMHRLVAPRDFPDKNRIIKMLEARMEKDDAWEGDLYSEA